MTLVGSKNTVSNLKPDSNHPPGKITDDSTSANLVRRACTGKLGKLVLRF